MAETVKKSGKRNKPSYFMSILGVTLVLFLLGIIGWLVINANKLGNYFKEEVEILTELRGDLKRTDSVALMDYISMQPYIKKIEYVSKEEAKKRMLKDGEADWSEILDANPLPNSINFKVKQEWLNSDSLNVIVTDLKKQTYVSDVSYPKALVDDMNKNIQRISLVLLGLAIVLGLVVIFLIDNTIKLAMFSNRFTIKTMQMVGATRSFIARPLNIRAIVNGAISALIAIVAIYAIINLVESNYPEMKAIHDSQMLLLLFGLLLLLGITITLFSTYRSVRKYLRKKLDDLY